MTGRGRVGHGRVGRYVVTAGVMDFTIYVTVSLCALLARRWGAGPLVLGLLPVPWALVYSLTATFGGRISDRVSRTALARVGLFLVGGTCVVFSWADHVWIFFAGLPVIAFGLAFFWPALQAAIADESGPKNLTKNLGLFNVCWSLGKGAGVLAGGVLSDLVGRQGFLLAAATAFVLVVALPRVARGGGAGKDLVAGDEPVPRRTREGFRWAALLANFAAFGAASTLVAHFPALNEELGRSDTEYGILVGAVFFSQTLMFGTVLLRARWHYRAGFHLGVQALAMLGVLLVATGWSLAVQLPFVLLVGAGFALAYYSSIYYSLHADAARGGRAGLHESIIGSGNFLIPFAAGAAADLAGSSAVPYLVAGGVIGLSLLAQTVILARTRV
ncbi:MAG: MFS transporter [Planctomycetota bacterium]